MDFENKITAKDFENTVGAIESPITKVEWRGLQIEIKKNISLMELGALVRYVADLCFGEDGEYIPEFKDYATKKAAIEMYTNLELPSEVEARYAVLYDTDLWNVVTDHIGMEQFMTAIKAIDERINVTIDSNIAALQRQVAVFQDSVEKMTGQMNAMFEKVGADDIKKLVGAISNGSLDEEKLVKAFMENKEKSEEESK